MTLLLACALAVSVSVKPTADADARQNTFAAGYDITADSGSSSRSKRPHISQGGSYKGASGHDVMIATAARQGPAVTAGRDRHQCEDATLLRAIIAVENSPGNNPSQLSEAAKHDNRTPLGHLKWIKRTLVKRGMVPTLYLVALCWNAGCTTVFERRELARHRDFAERARNIYEVNSK